MALSPSQLLLQRLHEAFPDTEDANAALVVLDRFIRYGGEELQLAALKASGGQLWKLRELVKVAKKDFRDVFFEARSPEQVLCLKGRTRSDPFPWGRHGYLLNVAKRTAEQKRRRSAGP